MLNDYNLEEIKDRIFVFASSINKASKKIGNGFLAFIVFVILSAIAIYWINFKIVSLLFPFVILISVIIILMIIFIKSQFQLRKTAQNDYVIWLNNTIGIPMENPNRLKKIRFGSYNSALK
jgi:hypothetical protein